MVIMPNMGKIKSPTGDRQDVAVMCWFTADGKIMPVYLKYAGQDGFVYRLELAVVAQRVCNYAGIPSVEFIILTDQDGVAIEFTLVYLVEQSKWRAVWQ